MIYKLEIDIRKILPLLKKLGIHKYRNDKTYVFIKADNPDDACGLAIEQMSKDIITVNDTPAVRDFIAELSTSVRVTKIRGIGPRSRGL